MIPIIKANKGDLKSNLPPNSNGKEKAEESDFLKLLRTVKKKELSVLAQLLMPYIAEYELRHIRVWGDKSRVNLNRATISVNDLLINTRSGCVTIEEDCFFGHRCMLLTENYNNKKKGQERSDSAPESGCDIHVKKGVLMGSGAIVLGPAVIGENAVITAGSLVIGDVPANTIVSGNPAKPVNNISGGNL